MDDIKENEDNSLIVSREGHSEYKSIITNPKWYNYFLQIPIVIGLIIVFCNVQKTTIMLQDDIKSMTPTFIHDTTIVSIKAYRCWQCKKELVNILKGSVTCCGYEYKIVNNELIAKRLDE